MNSIEAKETRKFGFVAFGFFGLLCALGIWSGKPVPIVVFGLLSLLGFGFIVLPKPMRPVHAGWLKGAHFIGRIITVGMLALAFYLVITPAGLIKRFLGGGRPLPCKPDKFTATYWIERPEPVQPIERFKKRF